MPSISHSVFNSAPSQNQLRWRVIPLETHDAFMNMALDEACMEAMADDGDGVAGVVAESVKVMPTIRFYQWKPSAVSIGYFQSLEDEVAVDRCVAAGVDVIRRRTGGGAVYHDFDGEITYSILAPESLLPSGITESYHVICGWIVDGLREVGIETVFKPINDIVTVGGKKISGNAQTRRNGIVLQHGTILYNVDVRKMFSLLKVGQEKIADKLIAAVEDRVTCVRKLCDATKEETYHGLLRGFTRGKDFAFGEWTQWELDRAHELVVERYKTDAWNRMR